MSGQRLFSHGIATPFSQDEGRTSIILFLCNCEGSDNNRKIVIHQWRKYKKAELSHSVNHKKDDPPASSLCQGTIQRNWSWFVYYLLKINLFYQSSDDYHIINTKLNLLYIFVADRINAFLALSSLRIAVLPSWKRLTGGRFFLHQIGLRIKAIWLTSYRIWLPMSLFWASRLLRLPLSISTIFISACKVIVRARQAV